MKHIVTIGGGIAGIEASDVLAEMGYKVTLVEKEKSLGGNVSKWSYLFPNMRPIGEIEDYMKSKYDSNRFTVIKNTEVNQIKRKKDKLEVSAGDELKLIADSVIVATGFEVFDAKRKEEYGYKIYDNVITSVDLENMLKNGKNITTPTGKIPKKIAFIHCVGSRDEKSGNHYCSKLCCVTSVKQAIEMNEILPDAEIYCLYIDLRMYGLEFEELYLKAQKQHNIQFIRGKLSEAAENMDKTILIKAEDTLSGYPIKMNVDLVVLLVGMESGKNTQQIGKCANLSFNSNRFLQPVDPHLARNNSSQAGIFLAGTCSSPMSVKETLDNARSAAVEVHKYLMNSDH
ncbi:MAG: CoB--CoM heterodisulfide reductase iron-sulfur subunit A family protein [Bacteroidales bacterium]|nr:CoB--CoM heterodisulfide reductase iron-sulfur subunit A family protein [Bacteroidales bacterium]